MRESTARTAWKIICPSSDVSERLKQWLASRIDLDRVLVDAVCVMPGGIEQVENVPHRLGDYFSAIGILPGAHSQLASFQLVFVRRPEAGRFWKDLMVNILQEIESNCHEAAIQRDTQNTSNESSPD